MLTDSPMTTILPVVDMARARAFYEGKLGLRPVGQKPDGKFSYRVGAGGLLSLFPRGTATRADHTAVSFEVPDVERAVGQLQDRGVVFQDYDLPGLKTVEHVCVLGSEKAAWFNDTEGNILCIHENLH
jgi:catechol 2,3-dioxygenase-like lactoylglutathione lyase family enzyme